MSGIRLAVPETAMRGETVEIKALIRHEMESGFRRGARGEVIPREILTRFECRYNDRLVFASDFHPAISANPILTFYLKASESGRLDFQWTDQNGQTWQEQAAIEVV